MTHFAPISPNLFNGLLLAVALFASPAVQSQEALQPSRLKLQSVSHPPLASSQAKGLAAKGLAEKDPALIAKLSAQLAEGDQKAAAGKWREAIGHYEAVLRRGVANGSLFFQLGVCHYRLGHKGRSLFYFKMAQRMLPRNEQIAGNIALLTSQRVDAISDTRLLRGWDIPLSHEEWQVAIIAIACVILMLLIAMQRFGLSRWLGGGMVALLLATIAFLAFSRSEARTFGVVLADKVAVHSGPHPFDVALFKLNEGTEVSVVGERVNSHGRWWQITLHDGKSGWIAARNLLTSNKVI